MNLFKTGAGLKKNISTNSIESNQFGMFKKYMLELFFPFLEHWANVWCFLYVVHVEKCSRTCLLRVDVYLLTYLPTHMYSLHVIRFILLSNTCKKLIEKILYSRKKVIQFWIHCLHFQCTIQWNFYLPGLDAVQFQIPQCRIFSRSAGHQIFTNLKTFGEIVFARPFRMV